MHAHDVLRTLGEGGDLVHIERGGVGCQNRAGLGHFIELLEDLLLHAQLLEHGLDDEVGILQIAIVERGGQQAHALLVLLLGELALLDLGLVVLANGRHAAIQGFLLGLQDRDGNARIQEVHGNAAAHGAGTDHAHGADLAHRCIARHVGDLGGGTLGHEQMAQRTRLGSHHQLHEGFALGHHAVVELLGRGVLDGFQAAQGRREVLGHALHHGGGKLEIGLALGMLAGQVTHTRQRADIGDLQRQGLGLGLQRLGRSRHLAEQLLARQHGQHFAHHGLAADNHVECGFHTQYTRQALGAAGAWQQAQLDLGQRHGRAGGGNAVMASQRQLQPASHANAVNRGDHRLGRQVQLLDDRNQMRLAVGIFLAELGDIGSAGEGLAGAGNDDGLDGVIRQSLAQTLNHTSSGGQIQAVDRRVVQGNDGDGSVHFVFSSHAVVPCSINRKERSCVFYFPNFAALRN